MRVEKVVINASPFILLCKSGLADLLPELFSEIYMPERVSAEIIEGNDLAAEKLYDYQETWITRVLPDVAEEVLVWNLGDGETDVLSFSLRNQNITALVDDRAARKCAETLNIKSLGTGGILLLAKRRGLIDSVGEALKKLQSAGLYISNEIIDLLKKQAGESK